MHSAASIEEARYQRRCDVVTKAYQQLACADTSDSTAAMYPGKDTEQGFRCNDGLSILRYCFVTTNGSALGSSSAKQTLSIGGFLEGAVSVQSKNLSSFWTLSLHRLSETFDMECWC